MSECVKAKKNSKEEKTKKYKKTKIKETLAGLHERHPEGDEVKEIRRER